MYAVNGQWSLGQTETNSWETTLLLHMIQWWYHIFGHVP